MANKCTKKHPSFSPLRRRRQAAKDRRFYMIWIKRMVNKQVEKQIAELQSQLLLMQRALRDEMEIELQRQLQELLEEARGRSPPYTKMERGQRLTSRWPRIIEEEFKRKTKQNEQQSSQILVLSTTLRKPPKGEAEKLSDILPGVSTDGDTSGVSSDAHTSQFMKESERATSSRTALRAHPRFVTEQLRCAEEKVQVDVKKEEEALLMRRQWEEWLDKQEMRGRFTKAEPADTQNTEKPRGTAPPAADKQTKSVKGGDTMNTFKTYLGDLFNGHTSYKWKRFEDED